MSSGVPAAPKSRLNVSDASPDLDLLRKSPNQQDSPSTHGTVLVISFDAGINSFKSKGQGRAEAGGEIRAGFKKLLDALDSEDGLRYTIRQPPPAKSRKDELYFLISITPEALKRLLKRERDEDFIHSIPRPSPSPIEEGALPAPKTDYSQGGVSEADQIRVVHDLLRSSQVQGGLGITPGQGDWQRVSSIIALHDEQVNRSWVQSWLGRHWAAGLVRGVDQGDSDRIREHFGPDIALYFSFLSFYTRALIPVSVVGIVFWLGSKGVWAWLASHVGLARFAHTGGPKELGYGWDFHWLYGAFLAAWSLIVVEIWRVQERKLSVFYGTHRASRYEHFRPQYIARILDPNHPRTLKNQGKLKLANPSASLTTGRESDVMSREIKMLASVPLITACGVGLGLLLTAIFIIEAFLTKLYEGFGKQAVALVPTLLFAGIVPMIIGFYHSLSVRLVEFENHPTKQSYDKSLTIKTFAMNAIVAYLGLLLSAYVHLPFGEHIMAFFSTNLTQKQNKVKIASAEKVGLAPKTSVGARTSAKNARLVGQLFAYTVTNQAINAFQEVGLPYVKRRVDEWRNSDSKQHEKVKATSTTAASASDPEETRFLRKVQRELSLPSYSLFGDYAEMVTQFGYVAAFSAIWPLAPLCALVNNYWELRSDAIKICAHVQRPIGERIESIGPWLTVMSFISWMSFVVNSTLVYLFRPTLDSPLTSQTMDPNAISQQFTTYGSELLHDALRQAATPPVGDGGNSTQSALHAAIPNWVAHSEILKTVIPVIVPTLFIAMLASHAWFIVHAIVGHVIDRWLWQSSDEALGLEAGETVARKTYLRERANLSEAYDVPIKTTLGVDDRTPTTFWRKNTQEGLDYIGQVLKSE